MTNYIIDANCIYFDRRLTARNFPYGVRLSIISTKNGKTYRLQRSYKDTGFLLKFPPMMSVSIQDRLFEEGLRWRLGYWDLDLLGRSL